MAFASTEGTALNADVISDEEGRLSALHRYRLSALGPDETLDRILKVAQASIGAPVAAVTVVDRVRQTYLAVRGMAESPLPLDQSICARTIRDSRPLIIEDTHADGATTGLSLVAEQPGIRSYLGVPVTSGEGYNLGTVCVMDTRPRSFTSEDVTVIVNLARIAASHLAGRQLDQCDFLTGALTRRRFQLEVEREFERARRYERPASLVFIDVDNFRNLNGSLGPGTADEVLKAIANRCMEKLRSTDVFGRIGGEEFGMLLPETLAYESSQCAERLRETIAGLRFRSEAGVFSVTATLGIATLTSAIQSATQWFAQADVALYAAKRSGRNCVAFAPPPEDRTPVLRQELAEPAPAPKMH